MTGMALGVALYLGVALTWSRPTRDTLALLTACLQAIATVAVATTLAVGALTLLGVWSWR